MNTQVEPTIFYICNDPERALGPEIFLERYHIVCIDNSPILPMLKKSGVKYFSLSETLGEDNSIFRNSNRLLEHELTQKYIAENTPEGEIPNVIVFKIAPNIEHTAKRLGYKLLNSSSELNRKYENKLSQYEQLAQAGVDFPDTVIDTLVNFDFEALSDKLGNRMVLQFDRGHTGSGTVFISQPEELEELKQQFPKRKVRIAREIKGEAWTLNAAVTRFGTVYGGLCYQITGIPELTSELGGTVGNDWSRTDQLPQASIEKIAKITERVGMEMSHGGYRGLFGLDLIVTDNGEVYLIEVNARQPASTGMHTKLMHRNGTVPLLAFHIAEYLFEENDQYLLFMNSQFENIFDRYTPEEYIHSINSQLGQGIVASQVILRNRTGNELQVKKTLQPGAYNLELNRIGDAYSISDLEQGSFLLLHSATSQLISPGNEIARIQALESVLDDKGELKAHYAKMVEMINQSNDNFIKAVPTTTVDGSEEEYEVKELPEGVQSYIRSYFELELGGLKIAAPYFRNVKRVRAELRVLVGKGTAEELTEETLIYAKLRGYDMNGKSGKEIRNFMVEQGLGIDCSGYVAHIYNHYLHISGKGTLWSKLKYPNRGIYRNIIRMLRPAENAGADILTGSDNTYVIDLKEIEPGDLIRMKGIKGGHHLVLVYSVKYSSKGLPISFIYTHSISRYGDQNGVRFGEVVVRDPYGELKDQEWLEKGEDGVCWTLKELETNYEDNGLRRPKFKPSIEK